MANKLLQSRRQFLQKAALGGTVAGSFSLPIWAAPPQVNYAEVLPESMRLPGRGFTNYGQPSSYEKDIIRWISANQDAPGNGVSWAPLHDLQGTITPNGLHFERHHNGVPDIDPANHQFLIDGLVNTPLSFSIDALKRYPQQSKICFIECGGNSNSGWRSTPSQAAAGYAHGLVSNAEWTGVPIKLLLHEAGIQAEAKWAIVEAADGASLNVSIPLDKLLDDAILALYQNGERLRPENGYPLRLVLPGWEGIVNVKWLRQLRLTDKPVMSRNETAQYTELMPGGKARQFSFIMEAKSLITSPSLGMQLPDNPGIYQVSGLAWSGRGKISRVEVSADGGQSWVKANLQQPVMDRAFTRFSLPWQWQGQYAVLQSRATDETGYVQPSREELTTKRGTDGFFHYNAIVSWEVTEQGDINHVYGF
ncbi:sulfite dehydrogenase [Methylophaga sp. OBS4]|uniref:sulfite dehydrogenase n=1 Tax=Methylophaga sp. OBS4 TaxID=2991935 RepID=UPI002255F9B7|nr:sulfite dehydrogenase [Methylophaga sp. OBS4]MCX4188333.1 sulfite dehydrogenase [Methylophaga sp. OBS4]